MKNTIDQTSFSIPANKTSQLTVSINPSDAIDPGIVWSSSNNSVATINAQGTLTALSPGVTTITATTTDGNHTDSITVTVTAALPLGSAGNPVMLRRFNGSANTVETGTSIPVGGFYYNYAASKDTTITLISPHQDLRFRVIDVNGFLIFDSNDSDSGATRKNHTYGQVNNGFVQKINNMDSEWNLGEQYTIIVYSTTPTTPSLNGIEYYLFVGEPVKVTGTTHDILSSASVTWVEEKMWINYGSDVLKQSTAYNHPNTAKVTQISLKAPSIPINSVNWQIQNLNGGVNETGGPIAMSSNSTINRNINNAPMSGEWLFTISAIVPDGNGNAKPAVYLSFNYEIGD